MTIQGKDGVGTGKGKTKTSHRKSETRRRIFRELVHIAAEQGASIELGVSTADALQECLDRAVALYRFSAAQVDAIRRDATDGWDPDDPDTALSNLPVEDDPLFSVIKNPQGPDLIVPHRWLTMEREARVEVEKLAAMMTQLGIAERVVRVKEAEAALLVAAVREAAIEAGLDNDQVRRLGEALRRQVEEGLNKKTPSRNFGREDTSQAALLDVNRTLEEAIPSTATELPDV